MRSNMMSVPPKARPSNRQSQKMSAQLPKYQPVPWPSEQKPALGPRNNRNAKYSKKTPWRKSGSSHTTTRPKDSWTCLCRNSISSRFRTSTRKTIRTICSRTSWLRAERAFALSLPRTLPAKVSPRKKSNCTKRSLKKTMTKERSTKKECRVHRIMQTRMPKS
jgi:hypothetical protein